MIRQSEGGLRCQCASEDTFCDFLWNSSPLSMLSLFPYWFCTFWSFNICILATRCLKAEVTVFRGGAQCHQLHDRLDGLQKTDENLTKIRDWLSGHSEWALLNWAFYKRSLWGLSHLWSSCTIPLLDFSLGVFTPFTFCSHNRLRYSKRLPEETGVCVQLSPDSHSYHVSPFTATQSLFLLLSLWLQTPLISRAGENG